MTTPWWLEFNGEQPTLDDLPRSPAKDPRLVHLWTECPDCGVKGAHHPYTDKSGESVGVRCG